MSRISISLRADVLFSTSSSVWEICARRFFSLSIIESSCAAFVPCAAVSRYTVSSTFSLSSTALEGEDALVVMISKRSFVLTEGVILAKSPNRPPWGSSLNSWLLLIRLTITSLLNFGYFSSCLKASTFSVDVLLKSLGLPNVVNQPMKAPSNVRSTMSLILAEIMTRISSRSISFSGGNFQREIYGVSWRDSFYYGCRCSCGKTFRV